MTKHEEMVRRLVKPGQVILSQLTPDDCHLWHMVTGLMGEAVEFALGIKERDNDNIIEEGGDSCFYQTALFQIYNLEFNHPNNKIPCVPDAVGDIGTFEYIQTCGSILDLVKKKVIYRKNVYDEQIRDLLVDAKNQLQYILALNGLSIGTCLDHNYKKLGKRYEGHQYTDEAAQARKDKNGED